MKFYFVCFGFLMALSTNSQSIDTAVFDTIYSKRLRQVDITDTKKVRTDAEEEAYQRLKRKVIRLYPYALMARQVNMDIHSNFDTFSTKKEKRKYKAATEKALRERFELELKNLYRSDGEVLVKLIHRETGLTTYQLVRQFKSGFNVWTYQIAAKTQGFSLKETYDFEKDKDIEGIIQFMQKEGSLPTGY